MRLILTDVYCKTIKAPASGRTEVADARCSGLTFRVTRHGARSWAFRFRDPTTRRPLRATIGAYPDVTLSAARQRADEMRGMVAAGVNPIESKRREKTDAPNRTFRALSDRYLTEHAERHKRPRSIEEDRRNLKIHILPYWGERDYRNIKRADVIELIERIVAAGSHTAGNRVHALISKIFSFGVDADLLDANPAARLRKRGAEVVGRRVLSDHEIRLFWPAIVLRPVSRALGLALRLAGLTGARANEAAGAAKREFQNLKEPAKAAWVIPGARTKNKRDHLIPLSPLAVETVNGALELSGGDEEFLFPSPIATVDQSKPIDRHALATAMARFADQLKGSGEAVKTWRAEPPSPHDLRRTAETRLSELGVSKEDRNACLNHVQTDVASKHYDLYERAKEKRIAFDLLAAAFKAILTKRAGAVVPIAAARRRRR
jgi:integrase